METVKLKLIIAYDGANYAGWQTQASGVLTFPVIQQRVRGIVTVSDAQLVRTMRFFMERMKLVVEPTGCLGAALALEGVMPLRGQRVGVILSGGNVDVERLPWLPPSP